MFRLKILEPNVPDKGAECFDGIHLIALRANESQPEILVGILWKPFLGISRIIIAGVFESVKTHVA